MPVIYAPEQRQKLVGELTHLLNATTLQALRGIARQWGWPVRGTAKLEVIDQILAFLTDTPRMAAAARQLSEEERETLGWLSALRLAGAPEKSLQTALEQSGGHQMTQKAVGETLQRLVERGLAFFSQYRGYQVPGLYREWLPALAVPRLRYGDEPGAVSDFSLTTLNQHAQHLLSAIETDRPATVAQPPAMPSAENRAGSDAITAGLVNTETLDRWGYLTADERHLARFLLEQMVTGGLGQIEANPAGPRLVVVANAVKTWTELPALQRLSWLREWCVLTFQQPGRRALGSWSEVDLAVHDLQTYRLRFAYYYAPIEQLQHQIAIMRAWLLGMLQCLSPGVWLSIEQLGRLIYHLHRDLLNWDSDLSPWRWFHGNTPLDPQKMDFDTWMRTYGRLIVAFLTGPATWLLYVQIGYADKKPAAFRYLEEVEVGDVIGVPPDALRFPAADVAVLRNTWQTGELRQLIRRIAVETGRDLATTTYRLEPNAFRRTIQAGLGAAQIVASFAAADFPLPAAMQATLQAWQDRLGRHQLYDNLAIIEFNDEVHPEELRIITGLPAGQFYPVSPRCLVVLNPEAIPALVDELRRRGYTPRVLP